jgi:glutathione-specific gamma-glutamylcyclotransferase
MNQGWVFGYGSLMWNPGFEYISKADARIDGYHRSLCVYSLHHRGTREAPGLVLGLDQTGGCTGVVFEIHPEKWQDTLSYLRAREQISSVYVEIAHPVEILATGQRVEATTFVADTAHAQYAGKLDHAQLISHVKQGVGDYGRCLDYVANTLAHLRGMGIRDETLEAIGAELGLLGA